MKYMLLAFYITTGPTPFGISHVKVEARFEPVETMQMCQNMEYNYKLALAQLMTSADRKITDFDSACAEIADTKFEL